jgi:hypothetical protein
MINAMLAFIKTTVLSSAIAERKTRIRNICQLSVLTLAWPRSVEFLSVFHFAPYCRTLSVTRLYFSVE